MSSRSPLLSSCRIGLALSGGSVRGLAHIGVIKALSEAGIRPAVIAGTSAGSLVGASLASGKGWEAIAEMARSVLWPTLLHGGNLERFCAEHLPETFDQLAGPFAAIATAVPSKQPIVITRGHLATAISASCALRGIRRSVVREGLRLKDGGIACVLPARVCLDLGAEFVVSSDVWELSQVLRGLGLKPHQSNMYPEHFRTAVASTDILIQPDIPIAGYIPTSGAVDRMIAAGERACRQALSRIIG